MALLVVALGCVRRCRAGVAVLAVIGAFLFAPGAALADGTLTIDASGEIAWIGAQNDQDNLVLTYVSASGTFVFSQTAGGTISLADNSAGVVTASSSAPNTVEVAPGTGSVTSITFDDLGVSNTITIDKVATALPITVQNTSGRTGNDTVVLTYNTSNVSPQLWSLTNTSVALDGLVSVTLGFASTTHAQLTLNGGSGVDNLIVAYSGTAGGLVGATLNLGAGNDQVVVQSTAAGTPLTIQGVDGADTVRFGSDGVLATINGAVSVGSLFGRVGLTIDGHADTGAHTVTMTSSGVTGMTPAAITFTGSQIDALSVTANNAGNTFTISSAVTGGAGVTETVVETGSGDDTFNMSSALPSTAKVRLKGGSGSNTLDYTGRSSAVSVNLETGVGTDILELTGVHRVVGGSGADTFTVGGVATVLGGAGNDTLILNGTGDPETCEVYASSGNTIVSCSTPTSFGVATTSVETITLNTGGAADAVTIRSTQSGQAVTVNGGDGNDTVSIGETGSVKGIHGQITVDGGADTNEVTISDQATTAPDVVTVTGTAVGAGQADTLFGSGGRFAYTNLSDLTIRTGTGADSVTVTPSTGAAITLIAGSPSATPGDTVNVLTSGLSDPTFFINPPNGSFFATGRGTITFQAFETLLANGVSLNGGIAFSSSTYSVNEGAPTATISLSRSGFAMGAVSVTLTPSNGTAASPADFDASPIVVNFADGQTTASAQIPIVSDSLYETAETVDLTLTDPTGGAMLGSQRTAVLTIQNDDPVPGLRITGAGIGEGHSGTRTLNFQVALDPPSNLPATVNYTTSDGTAKVSDGDYATKSGQLVFSPGETSKTITVVINGDHKVEPNETFTLALTSPSGASLSQATAAGTIVNDDAACAPRPTIQTTVVPGNGVLATTVTATLLNDQQANLITELRFGPMVNARVTVEGRTITGPATIQVTPGKWQVGFVVQRVQPGHATTVPFTVVDGCSTWDSFVGGGTGAGF